MPPAIDRKFVHRPVDEADLPPLRPSASFQLPTAPRVAGPPAAAWGTWPIGGQVRRARKRRAAARRTTAPLDLTPLVTMLFFFWIALCFIFEVLGAA